MGNICIFFKQESVEKMKKSENQAFLLKKTHGCKGAQTKASVYCQKIHVILMTSLWDYVMGKQNLEVAGHRKRTMQK